MAIYCSLEANFLLEIDHPPDYLPDQFYLGGGRWGCPAGVYRLIDSHGHYLGWMQVRIERAFEKVAATSPDAECPINMAKLGKAITLYRMACLASGVIPCRLEDIPAGYGPPAIPDAFQRPEGATTDVFFPHQSGRGSGGGVASGGRGDEVELTRRARAMAGSGDGGREWQAELGRWF